MMIETYFGMKCNPFKKGFEQKNRYEFNDFKENFKPIKDWWNNHVAPWFTWEKWSKIAEDAEIRQNHISKVLSELKAHELVECINPEVRKGRLYRHTEKGNKIAKRLD